MNNKIPKKEILEELYLIELLPMHKVAKVLNISVGSVYNYLKKYEIVTRPKKETFTMKGKKWTKEQRENKSRIMKGRKLSEETKQKMKGNRIGIGSKKIRSDGYVAIYFPSHPKSTKDGYIMEHDLIMECLIGRWLQDDEVVHHKNKIKNDNRASNLQLMTKSEHTRMHVIERKNKKEGVLCH